MSSRIDRKDLLRKSQKDLMKECKKRNISIKGTTTKSEIIDLIIMKHSNPSRKKLKKKKLNRFRSKSIADTLVSKSSKNKILHKRTGSVTDSKNRKELRIDSLLRLNTMDLNESKPTKIAIKTDELFENMNISDIQQLNVNDYIDFRAANGYVYGAIVTNKNDSVLTLNFKNNIGRSENVLCDYNKEINRFAKYKTISKRKTHKTNMNTLQIGNIVDINVKHITNNEWIIGEIVNKDFRSGQCQVEFSYNKKKYLYWIHTDNVNEIAPYLTHYDINNNIPKYLNEIDCKTPEFKRSYSDGYKTLKMELELYISDKNKLEEINKLLEYKENEHKIEINKLKQRVYIQQEEILFLKSTKDNKKKKKIIKTKTSKTKSMKYESPKHKNISKSKTLKSISRTPTVSKSKSSWKSRDHTFESKTPKNNRINKKNCKSSKNIRDKNKNKDKKRSLKKQESLRYDENVAFKIKGLSALDLFVKEYEEKKKKAKEKDSEKNGINSHIIDEKDDFSTDDDFDDQ